MNINSFSPVFRGFVSFYKKDNLDLKAADFECLIESNQLYSFEYNSSLFGMVPMVKIVFEDNDGFFRSFLLQKALTFIEFAIGPYESKIFPIPHMQVIYYKIIEDTIIVLYAVPPLYISSYYDNTKLSFKKGTSYKVMLEKILSSFSTEFTLHLDKEYDSLQTDMDFYYRGNLPNFLQKYVLPNLPLVAVAQFSKNRLFVYKLNISEKPNYFIFTKHVGIEDRATTQSDYGNSIWSHSNCGDFKIDPYTYTEYGQLDLLNGSMEIKKFPNNEFMITAPFKTEFDLSHLNPRTFIGPAKANNNIMYNILIEKYKTSIINVISELNPQLGIGLTAYISPLDNHGRVIDAFYRGLGVISNIYHTVKRELYIDEYSVSPPVKEKGLVSMSTTHIIKPGSYAGNISGDHKNIKVNLSALNISDGDRDLMESASATNKFIK